MVRDGIGFAMKLRNLPLARTAVLAASISIFQPMLEGCSNLPPVGHPVLDSGVSADVGRGRDGGGTALDAGTVLPDAGRPSCPAVSERLYAGGGPASFDGDLFVLESAAGYSAEISISDVSSGASTFVSIPQWGSQTITLSGKTITIFVNETYDGSPSWADLDIYGC